MQVFIYIIINIIIIITICADMCFHRSDEMEERIVCKYKVEVFWFRKKSFREMNGPKGSATKAVTMFPTTIETSLG